MAGGQMQRASDGDVSRGAQQLPPGTALVRSGTEYQTAVTVQVKRDLGTLEKLGGRVLARCEVEAALMGEEFFYGWDVNDGDRGKKRIGGVTIDGAMMLLRNWGNAAVEVELLETASDYYILKAILIDLETGATTPRLYRKHRSKAPGSMLQQRWDDMSFSDGQSRAIRNVIVHALPLWLQNRCMDAARLAAANNIVDPDHELGDIRNRAKAVGIDAKRIEAKLGKDFDKWSKDDFVQLRGMFRAIEEEEPKDRHAKALLVFALPEDANTMPSDQKGESLVDKFGKRMRAAWNQEDLDEVVKVVKSAADDGKLGETEVAALRKVYAEKRKTFGSDDKKSERGSAGPADPNDDAREP